MTSMRWRINRLRAMSPAEVVHRGSRWLQQRAESRRVRARRHPKQKSSIQPGIYLLDGVSDWQKSWSSHFVLDYSGLDEVIEGRIRLFGHDPLYVGDPVRWHQCPKTGISAPRGYGKSIDYRDDKLVGNIKFGWELGRHQHLGALAIAYAVTGEKCYRQVIAQHVDSWIAENPYGLGIHWCSSLETALRLVSWALVHSVVGLRDDDGLFGMVRDASALGRSIYEQAHFIRGFLSRHSSANNHLIGELTGLLVACRAFDMGRCGVKWAAFAHRELELEAARQVHADGVCKEQAIHYHLSVMEFLLVAWLVELRAGEPFSKAFRQRIEAMIGFLNDVTPDGGMPPQIGDSDDGMVARFDIGWPNDPYLEVTSAAESALGIGPARQLSQKAFWYTLLAGRSFHYEESWNPVLPPFPRCYPDSGYAVLGDGNLRVVFDAGPLGYPSIAAHGHADALSLCLAVGPAWWLVDPGTYAYHSEPVWRDYFRGTGAHNTIRIDGVDQSQIGGPFLWLARAHSVLTRCERDGDRQVAQGNHDGYRKFGVIHDRHVELDGLGGRVRIVDQVEGSGTHLVELFFHFAPQLQVRIEDDHCIVRGRYDDTELQLSLDPAFGWQVIVGADNPPLGWYSHALEKRTPAPVLRGAGRFALPRRIDTSITVANIGRSQYR